MSIKPKTKPLLLKNDRALRLKVKKGHFQPVVKIVLKVEGKKRFEDNMSEGSIALRLGRNPHPPNTKFVGCQMVSMWQQKGLKSVPIHLTTISTILTQ
jgi:hypothetical protein